MNKYLFKDKKKENKKEGWAYSLTDVTSSLSVNANENKQETRPSSSCSIIILFFSSLDSNQCHNGVPPLIVNVIIAVQSLSWHNKEVKTRCVRNKK